MRIKGIGINAHPDHTGGEIENLERDLKFFQDIGYDYFDGMLEMADYAESKRVLICIENIEIDSVQNVVDFVKGLNCKSIKMTFDLGHAFLAAKRLSFDFLESIKVAKPYIRHIHIHDNFGRFEDQALEILKDYEEVFMLEYYYHRYRPQAREILEAAKLYVRRHSPE